MLRLDKEKSDWAKIIAGRALAFAVLTGVLLAGCGFQTYSPKPLAPADSAARYRAHNTNSPDFHTYLLAQGYSESQLPLQKWGLRELTYSALFFHPQLDVARGQWRAAQAAEITAVRRPDLGLSGRLEHHSQSNGGTSPWSYGLSLDYLVETANKAQIRLAVASQLSEVARIAIAQSAWHARSRLHNSLIDYHASLQQARLLEQEVDLRSEITAMLAKRLSLGMISSVEISNPRLQLQKAQQALQAEQGRASELRAALATNAGLPAEAFNQLELDFSGIADAAKAPITADMQAEALQNRLDIRASLAHYAAAEARLRLEIARQYPDLILSPGYFFDQGDSVWSLGWSTFYTLLNKNAGLIGEARALREVEAAQFEALQAQVIGDVEQARARFLAGQEELDKARELQVPLQASTHQIEQQFNAGFADRLELTTAKLENLLAAQNQLTVEIRLQRAASALEDAMQRPLQADAAILPANIEQGRSDKQGNHP